MCCVCLKGSSVFGVHSPPSNSENAKEGALSIPMARNADSPITSRISQRIDFEEVPGEDRFAADAVIVASLTGPEA
jgi:hypothetical protein